MQSLKGKVGGQGVEAKHSDITRSAGEDKNLLPFRYRETENQPGVPELSGISGRLQRSINPGPAPVPVSVHDNVREEMGEIRRSCMTDEDRKLFYEMIAQTRANAIICLETLARYDEGFTMRQAEVLYSVAAIIHNAEVTKA